MMGQEISDFAQGRSRSLSEQHHAGLKVSTGININAMRPRHAARLRLQTPVEVALCTDSDLSHYQYRVGI